MVEGPLAAALSRQDGEVWRVLAGTPPSPPHRGETLPSLRTARDAGDETASLAAMLGGVGRADAIHRLYCSARLPPLLALWDGYAAGTPFATWLPGFYEQVARALANEAAWCAGALPSHSPALPMALLEALLARVDKPFRQRLGVAMAASAGEQALLQQKPGTQGCLAVFCPQLSPHVPLCCQAAAKLLFLLCFTRPCILAPTCWLQAP